MKRFDVFIIGVTVFISLIVFSGVYVILYRGIRGIVEESTLEQTRGIARQTFNDMYQVMRRGWKREELLEFLKGIEAAHRGSKTKVKIYRSKLVEELFGKMDSLPDRVEIRKALRSKGPVFFKEDGRLVYIYPLLAKKECLRCHVNAKERDILGVIEVKSDISYIVSTFRKNTVTIALLTIPLPILGAFVVVYIIKGKIDSSIRKLDETFEDINEVSDLSGIKMEDYDLGFVEMNRVKNSIQKLIDRMQGIAIDRDILEFEIRLLEKFIITSEAVTNWESFLKDILAEVFNLLKYVYFFVIFREDEDRFTIKVFWKIKCEGKKHERFLEEAILEELKKTNVWVEGAEVKFHHENVGKTKVMDESFFEEVRLFSKLLLLNEPLIGGAVGIGVCLGKDESNVKKLAIEGLLTTILNIIGSIRAINRYTKELEYFATRDPLTGLYNQRVFWELLSYEVERAKRHNYKFALFVVDIDNFKLINDSYGHSFGDELLKEVSGILRKVFRKGDIIARYGGDEFSIIVPYTEVKESGAIAKRLFEAFERFSIQAPDRKKVKITASLGIAVFPDHAGDAKTLFIIADDMMYRAKREGRNKYMIASYEEIETIGKEVASKSFMVLEMLEKRKVLPYFQPILDLRKDKVEGYEVLMRVEHEGEILPASEFIDVAENLGVIHRLNYILMEKAMRKVKDRGCKPVLFFNLSPKEIILSEFISEIEKLVDGTGYERWKIVFEITERETVRNLDILKKFVETLKSEGFRFAVDDFGSGFASFTYLKLFPIDIVKIDGDFIRSMLTSEIDRAFVESAVSMAKALNIKTIAEYVEDEAILEAVRETDIDYAQGFLIGKPSKDVC